MPNSKHPPKAAQSSVAGDTIQHKRSDVPGLIPDSSELSYGELAINIKDMRLYAKDAAGYVHEIGDGVEVYGPSNLPPFSGVEKGDIWLSTDPSLFSPTFDPSTIHPIPGPPGPKGEPGMSAYAEYVQRTGSALTFDEFMGTLTGPHGVEGPKGDPGETLKVDGFVPTSAGLPASPPILTVYVTQDTGRLWVYDPSSTSANAAGWVDMGKIHGPPGNDVRFLTSVATAANLPATAQAGDICFATVDGDLHAWNDTTVKWDLVGRLRGDGAVPGTADKQILVWSASNSQWEPTDPTFPTSIGALSDVDDVIGNLGQDCVMVWDEASQVWTDSRSIEIDDIEFDASGPGTLLEGIAAYSDAGLDPTKDTWVPSCLAVDKYIREGINLEFLLDCNELKFATNGQVPVWNDTTSQWEPQDPSAASPIIFLGTGAWNAANVTSEADNYGMASDTVPDPAVYPPLPGDQYIDLATGNVTAFTGAPGAKTPSSRSMSAITGGASPIDAVPTNLSELGDVTVATPTDGQVLTYKTDHWENQTIVTDTYTKAEVDAKVGVPAKIVAISATDYNALATKDPQTLYVLT